MSKIRMAILGCGGMSGEHAKRFKKHDDVEIVALCDVSTEVVQTYIERNLGDCATKPAIFTDAAQMYAQAKPDAVTIVTPHTLHFEHGMQALQAGCHVLMEKPMVTNSTQAKELAAEVERTGKILVVGYNTPCTPEFKYLRELVRNEELGKLQLASGWLSQNWKSGTAGSWRQNPALSGGGQMYDSGAHLFNSLVWTIEQPISEVAAFIDNSGTPVDINGSVNIRFQSGAMATIVIGGDCPASGAGLMLIFENGRVDVDGWNAGYIKVWKGDRQVKYLPITGEAQTPNDNFIDAILGRAEPRTTPLNGINQSILMDAIYRSAESGQVVKL